MRPLLAILVLNILYTNVQSQFLQSSDNVTLKEKDYVNVDGSPYYNKEWKTGGMRDRNETVTENMMIRYDSYRDDVQFLRDGKTLVVDPLVVCEFYFLEADTKDNVNKTIFKNTFIIPGYKPTSYFQVLYESDKVKFLRKIKTNYLEEVVNNYGTNEQVKKFVRMESDFLIINSTTLLLKKGRKEVVENFGRDADSIRSFIREKKLNIRDDNDLIKILQKYSELSRD